MDFSLATRATRDIASLALPTAFVGPAHYVAPEQTGRLDLVVDRRSDLYALGATLYHLFTGRPPFEGDDIASLVHAHIARVPERADQSRPACPRSSRRSSPSCCGRTRTSGIRPRAGWPTISVEARSGGNSFELGSDDAPTVLRVRDALVGREAELGRLEALTRDLARGNVRSPTSTARRRRQVGAPPRICSIGRHQRAESMHAASSTSRRSHSPYPRHCADPRSARGSVLGLPAAALEALRDRLEVSVGALAPALVDAFPVASTAISARCGARDDFASWVARPPDRLLPRVHRRRDHHRMS